MSTKRARSPSSNESPNIFRSESIEEQKSVFIAAFSQSLSVKALQGLPEFRTATHRIAAWRKRSRQRSLMPETKILFDLGHEDDGEKWAGARLQNALNDMQVEGVVVVARWYGGQNIGPVRFTHIENTAKEAIWKWQVADKALQKEEVAKRQKREEDEERQKLENDLRDRDKSIFALRGLLAQKKAKLDNLEEAPLTPQKPMNYSAMTVEMLKRQDKSRDASIALILKKIDEVEEQLKLVDALDESTQASWKDAEEYQNTKDDVPTTPKRGES
ncbi:hypothetical protein B0J11DRAFT_213586 [Dendryphion nanum]|uniref:Impact N-terminal domain-containing protein n=1 Tax=Dendryphion nanum TaxID=256645 RepID=A0A9P9E7L0_9PLEO|nr:hypothetical protein B0J11DRAFT_213586 [Dendryphion nanum]